MSKQKIDFNELLKDIDKAFDLIKKIESNNPNLKEISLKAKKLKNSFEKKYPKNLDSE
jgi:hypothetical protein